MRYEDITEDMWDKIEVEGIVVLEYTMNPAVSFVSEYFKGDDYFVHTGNEVASDLKTVVEYGEGWTDKWVVVTRPESKTTDIPTINIIEQWLDKYQQVASADYTIGKIDTSDYGVCLTTDHGDLLGSKQVVEFINNRYSQLKSAENQSKLKELQAKKDKLMLELVSVDGEINELEV